MTERTVTGDCLSCESVYEVSFTDELVSEQLPEHCPFCGEVIESISEEYIEDDEQDDETKWD
jgi:hypothetical protein